MTEPALLVSLHDVTPAHADRLERAERLLTALGVPTVAYLFVPNFHGLYPCGAHPDFRVWCRSARAYHVQWFLHGYFHRERIAPASASTPTVRERCARAWLTAGEGEFLALRGDHLEQRLRAGIRAFSACFDELPSGFVAPAWLYTPDLIPALGRQRVAFTESHFHVFDLRGERAVPAPVLTWTTRSSIRRIASRAVTGVQRRFFARRPIVRVALHPADFDHADITDSIARTIDALRVDRRPMTYAEACRLAAEPV